MAHKLKNATATLLIVITAASAASLLTTACLSPITPTAGSTSTNTNTATANPITQVNAPSQPAASQPSDQLAPGSSGR